MTDAEELAERYLALWTQYLTALMADPRAMETLKRWMEFVGRFSYPAPGAQHSGGAPFPAWPPFFGPFGVPAPPTATDGSVPRGTEIAELARRVDALERRLAALERKRKPRAPRSARTGAR
jgi:hypothetical protein